MMFVAGDIRLRALEPEDLEWLYRIENDEHVWKWGNANVPYSRYALKKYIAESCHDIDADGQMRVAVVSRDEGTVVGCVDLMNFSPRHLRAEVGILIFPDYQGRGYGVEVLRMLMAYAREHLCLHLLYAVVSERNARARRAFEKAGFVLSGILADWLREGKDKYVSACLYCCRW